MHESQAGSGRCWRHARFPTLTPRGTRAGAAGRAWLGLLARAAGAAGMAGACAGVLSGCGSAAPLAQVRGVEVTQRGPEGVALVFDVETLNPRSQSLPLKRVDYTLSVAGREVFRASRSPEASMVRRGVQSVKLPVSIAAEDLRGLAEPGDGGDAVALTPEAAGETGARETGAGALGMSLRGTFEFVEPEQIPELLYENRLRVPTLSFAADGTLRRAGASAGAPTLVAALDRTPEPLVPLPPEVPRRLVMDPSLQPGPSTPTSTAGAPATPAPVNEPSPAPAPAPAPATAPAPSPAPAPPPAPAPAPAPKPTPRSPFTPGTPIPQPS